MQPAGRDECLRLLVQHLGVTPLGRDLGLREIASLRDFRESVAVRDRADHERQVEAPLGFGFIDAADAVVSELGGAERERDRVLGVWQRYLGETPPTKIALLRGRGPDNVVDQVMADDLREIGGELVRIDDLRDAAATFGQLADFDPELLVVPSVFTCRHLESVHRSPLERRLRRLRLILVEHDLGQPVRTRVPVRGAGWVYRSGRLGLSCARKGEREMTLAVGTQIIELLSYTNPEQNARRVYAERTVLPEEARLGQRYELVVSSPLGFVRLRTGEHVRVVGFDPPTRAAPFPRARVVRLAPAPDDVRLEGCTVAGAWLTASIRQALKREDPALVAAEIGPDPLGVPVGAPGTRTGSMRLPDAFKETELAWLARTGAHRIRRTRPRGLLVRVELQGFVGPALKHHLSERIDGNLRRRSPAYAYLRGREELEAPRVLVLKAGTRTEQERHRIEELLGGVRVPDVRVVG